MSEQSSTTSVYDSPVRLLAIIAASVFVSEALVMIILIILPPLPHVVSTPLDAALVTILIYPILYRFVVRPMTRHINERRQAEAALRRMQDELEVRVRQRTAELAEANESLQVQIVERQHAQEELKVALDLVQRRQAEMAGLLAGARAVLEYRDFKEVAQAIFVACRTTIGASAGYVALLNEDQSHETPVFLELGEQARLSDVALPMPVMGLRQQAYTTGQTVYTNDPTSCECTGWLPDRHIPLSSILFAPLRIKGFIVGTLGLANKPGGFSDDDVQLTTAFAELAAIAVLNSQTIGLLESSERRFRTLAQATFEGIAISEGEFIREANEQFARMHGYSLPEVIGRSIANFLVPHDHERMRQVVAGDDVHVGEYQALRKDGSLFLLEVRTYSLEQGGRSMRVAALRDITDRKLAEEALRARTALLSSIIESSDSAIFSIDREYRYTSFNRQHARIMKALLGVEIEIGRNLLEYYTVADDRQTTKQRLDRALSGESFVIEDWAGDGALPHRCFEISHNPVKDADQIIGVSVFTQDITERKYADQILRENEEWLRLAFDAGDLGRWRYVVASGMIHFDERARVHSGSDDNIMPQANVLMHIYPDDRALLQEEMALALNPIGHGRYAAEYRVCWPDGETHWLAVQARVHFEGEGEARQPVMAVGISQDVTARKRMEAALRESRSDLDRAQEVGQIGSWRLDVRRNVLTWSDENHRIFGVPKGTPLTYETFLGTVHPDDRAYVDRQWAASLAGEPYDIEHRIIADGAVKWVREKAYLEFHQDGDLLGGFGITQDITKRKQTEDRVTWLASFPELNPSPVVEVDWAGYPHYLNPAAKRLLPDLESGGHSHPWLADLELLGQEFQTDDATVLTREIVLGNTTYQQTLFRVPNSRRLRIYSLDVTARKRAEEQLRHSQALLEKRVLERTAELAAANNELRLQSAALQAAANGIVITDRQGGIQWANPAFAAMTGYAVAEVLGKNIRLLKSDEQSPEFYRRLWETILSGQVWQGELVNRRKDGSLYVEEQTIAPVLVEPGQIANFIAVKQDVTERKRAEARLTQNNRDLLALGNAERRARQIAETFAAASMALTQSLELEVVMGTLLDHMHQLIPYDSANVMLLQPEERLIVRAMRGYEQWASVEQTRQITFDARSNHIFQELLSQRKSILIPETRTHPDWDTRPGSEHVRSWIGVPIIAGGHVIGIYSLDKAVPGFFSMEHVRLAEALVGQAAAAMQNAWLFEQVRQGRERLQDLSRRLVEIQESERRYIARELHDEAGQALTSLMVGLRLLERSAGQPEILKRDIAELNHLVDGVQENLHRLAVDLRPASLDHLGLVAALRQYVETLSDKHELVIQFDAIGLGHARLPSEVETAVYRIVQEALTNVVRHSRATRADVLLERRGDRLVAIVEDNGIGFDVAQPQTGRLGLFGLRERAEMLGGTLLIESSEQSGTTLVAEVPCVS